MNAEFGIRITTYYRPSGSSYHLLMRCLKSIANQTFPHWKVFLMGDNYEKRNEFDRIAKYLPSDKITPINLEKSPEREKYSMDLLWKVAGLTASEMALEMIVEQKIPICIFLDDDDWWEPNHLEALFEGYQKFPESCFVYTQSTYKDSVLPNVNIDINYNNKMPEPYQLIQSAASWHVVKLPLKLRDIIETGSSYVAGDADLWDRMKNYCLENNLKTLYIPKLTTHHETEGFFWHNEKLKIKMI